MADREGVRMQRPPEEEAKLAQFVQAEVAARARERERLTRVRRALQLERQIRDCAEYCRESEDGVLERDFDEYPRHWDVQSELGGTGQVAWKRWSKINRIACKSWMHQWQRVAWLIHLNGLKEHVRSGQPEDQIQLVTHRLFEQFLACTEKDEFVACRRHLALELAKERESLARQLPLLRYRLSHYFDEWLWPRLKAVMLPATDEAPPPAPSATAPTAEPVHLPERVLKAAASYQWVMDSHEELKDDLRAIFDYILKNADESPYRGKVKVLFRTWCRYLRHAGISTAFRSKRRAADA